MASSGLASGEIYAPGFKDQPYWWEAAPPPDATLPQLPDKVDVAVIGGGYCGLNAALELRRQGLAVMVLEAERFGFGASSRNGGFVSGSLRQGEADYAQRYGAERAAALVEEAARALPFVEDLLQRESIQCDYRRTGRFVGAHWPGAYRSLESRIARIKQVTGLDARMLPRERQREEIGTDVYHGGMVAEGTGSLHPAKFHQGLAAAARRAGAQLVDGTRVTAIARKGSNGSTRFDVLTARGVVGAREVLLATNGYTTRATPWLKRRIIPFGSYIIATEPLDPALVRRLVPNGRMLSDTKRVLNYFRVSPDGTRVLFGGRARFGVVSARDAAPTLHRFMATVWPELARTRVTHAWMGNVAFTRDFRPHLGVQDGVHHAAGCQGGGVGLMSWLGYQAALKIAGRANRPSVFDDSSFPELPPLMDEPWFLPVIGAYYRFRDWMDKRAA